MTETYNYDQGDKLLSVTWTGGSKTFTYDGCGRTKTVTTSAGTTTLNYDYESRITSLAGPGVSSSYTYNGLNTRVGRSSSTAGSFTYKRDGSGVTAPLLSDGATKFTPGGTERRNGTNSFRLHDYLGSTKAIVNSSQAVTDTRQYDAFGQLMGSTGTTDTPFGFVGSAGYQWDDDTGLQLLGHRYYDASTGRFLTRDRIKDGRNWFVYCGNNPVFYVDPTGLSQGHHVVPQQLYSNGQVSAAAKAVFDGATTGGPIPGGHHYTREHRAYTKAVQEELDDFCKVNGIDPKKMTKEQAEDFVRRILTSRRAEISNFLLNILQKNAKAGISVSRGLMWIVRNGGKGVFGILLQWAVEEAWGRFLPWFSKGVEKRQRGMQQTRINRWLGGDDEYQWYGHGRGA